MVFGFFSRKPVIATSATPLEFKDNVTKPSIHSHRVQQLRTPSPSVVSGSVCNPNNSPTLSTIRPHSTLMSSPSIIPPETPSPPPPPPTDPSTLYSFLITIPPKILHEYTLSQLNPSSSPSMTEPLSPLTLTVLSSFFSALTPPPLLHCARCHKGFFEVENNDRSCTVPHDDESAEVERVGRGTGTRVAEYETLWGCCGKTVEGDGDMGPPDGWCYEGRHTTDPKRARFRADSTVHEDKLVSCAKLHCHDPPPPPSTRKTRKRPRKVMCEEESSSDREVSEGHADSEMEEIADVKKVQRSASVSASVRSKKGAAPSKGKRKAKYKTDEDAEKGITDGEGPTSVSMTSIMVKPRSSAKPKSRVKPAPPTTPKKPASISAPAKITPRSSSRIRKNTWTKMEEVADSEDEKPKKKRKVA